MRKIFATWALVLLIAHIGQAQTLDEILKSLGETTGTDKVASLKSVIISGKSTRGNRGEAKMTQHIVFSGKYRRDMAFGEMKMTQCLDGDKGWATMPMMGSNEPQSLDKKEVAALKNNIDNFANANLVFYKDRGHTAELLGKEDLEGTSVFKIKLTRKDGGAETYFIDAENYVVLKTTSKVGMMGREMEADIYYSNYKQVNGLVLPHSIEIKNTNFSNTTVIDSYDFSTEVKDETFKQ